jgi:hypothetical protein
VGIRELQAAGKVLEKRDDGLAGFGAVFSSVADARERGGAPHTGVRYTLQRAIETVDDEIAARLAGASAPFWLHVREALLASR